MRRRLFLVLQVLTWVLSYDGEQSPEPLAITAAGAALAVSGNLPFPSRSQPSNLVSPPMLMCKFPTPGCVMRQNACKQKQVLQQQHQQHQPKVTFALVPSGRC